MALRTLKAKSPGAVGSAPGAGAEMMRWWVFPGRPHGRECRVEGSSCWKRQRSGQSLGHLQFKSFYKLALYPRNAESVPENQLPTLVSSSVSSKTESR